MVILVRQATLIDPGSPHHRSRRDILIRNGIIEAIEPSINQPADQVISAEGLHASPGWVDIFTHGCEPGLEQKETLESCARAAGAGGFTRLFVLPNTQPVIHNRSLVEFIRHRQVSVPVSLHPIGAVSRQTEGRELAEMYDMHEGGAIAFSDGLRPLQSAGLLIKALQYIKTINGVLIQIPDDQSIAPQGLMHEGIISTRMGLPGKPSMAEEILVARDIKLARYTDSRIHFTGVSAAKSLEYIGRAKAGGLKVTCSVTPYHLHFTDEDLQDYDTNLKVNPPLRTAADRQALLEAVQSGLVDIVTAHHQPQEWDAKTCEFEYAQPGMCGLETSYAALNSLGLTQETIVERLAIGPRAIFALPSATILEGHPAEISLFQPDLSWTPTASNFLSKSSNSAFIGKSLKGKPLGILHQNKVCIHQP